MAITIFSCVGGAIVLPDNGRALVSREDGGNLVVDPPRPVWERSELSPEELTRWSHLVAAAGRAMIDSLPQLARGCVNYWEAGNWALHNDAPPVGRKRARDHRRVHLHLLGRSPEAKDAGWRWGEAPLYPRFSEREARLAVYERLLPGETATIIAATEASLLRRYGFSRGEIAPHATCGACGHPFATTIAVSAARCAECRG